MIFQRQVLLNFFLCIIYPYLCGACNHPCHSSLAFRMGLSLFSMSITQLIFHLKVKFQLLPINLLTITTVQTSLISGLTTFVSTTVLSKVSLLLAILCVAQLLQTI